MLSEFWRICLGVSVLLIAIAIVGIVLNMTGTQFRIVKQEKRLVIYRLGVFRDVVGPGLIMLNRHVDTVEREINVRSEMETYTVGSYFMHGVPFGYVLSFWRRVDLKAAAGDDREKLADLAQYSDEERAMQIREMLHEAFLKWVPYIEKTHKLRSESIGEKLLPIFPGVPECERLFEKVLDELQKTLPTIGVFPDMRQSTVLAIKNINVSPEVIAGFTDMRSMSLLRQQFPDLSEDMLLHALNLMKGIDPRMTRLYVEGSGAISTVRVDEDGDMQDVRVVPAGAHAATHAAIQTKPQLPKLPLSDDDLSEADWKVLKPTPRASAGG